MTTCTRTRCSMCCTGSSSLDWIRAGSRPMCLRRGARRAGLNRALWSLLARRWWRAAAARDATKKRILAAMGLVGRQAYDATSRAVSDEISAMPIDEPREQAEASPAPVHAIVPYQPDLSRAQSREAQAREPHQPEAPARESEPPQVTGATDTAAPDESTRLCNDLRTPAADHAAAMPAEPSEQGSGAGDRAAVLEPVADIPGPTELRAGETPNVT